MLFQHAKQLEHGVGNPIVARLTLQTLDILKQTNVSEEQLNKIAGIYTGSLVKRLLRCWEIAERVRKDVEHHRASFKPPARGAVSVEVPQVPRLEEDCHNFLHEARNLLSDLLQVFNLLHGTSYSEVGHWVRGPKGGLSVVEFAAKKFGEKHMNAVFFGQLPRCIAPYVHMRNAVDHPDGNSGRLTVANFTLNDGTLTEPNWCRVKEGKIEYGPLPIARDMQVCVQNLLILAEDILVMWALNNLAAPGAQTMNVIAETRRDPKAPLKYKVGPSAAFLSQIARAAPR